MKRRLALAVAPLAVLGAAAPASAFVTLESKPVKAPHGYKISVLAQPDIVSVDLTKGKTTVQSHHYQWELSLKPQSGRFGLHRTTLRGSVRFKGKGKSRTDPVQKGCTNPDVLKPGVLRGTLVFKPDRHFFKTLRLHNLPTYRRTASGNTTCGTPRAVPETSLATRGNPLFVAQTGGVFSFANLRYAVTPPRGNGSAVFDHSLIAYTGISLTAAGDLSSAHFSSTNPALRGSLDYAGGDRSCSGGGTDGTTGLVHGALSVRFDVVGLVTRDDTEGQLGRSHSCVEQQPPPDQPPPGP